MAKEGEEKTTVELKEIAEGLNKSHEELKKSLEAKADKVDVKEASEKLQKAQEALDTLNQYGEKGIVAYVEEMQKQCDEQAAKLKEIENKGGSPAENFQKQISDIAKNDEFVEALKQKQHVDGKFKIKAIDTSSFSADTGTSKLEQLLFPGVDKAPWLEDPVYRAINKRAVGEGLGAVSYYEEASRTDAAAKTAEGSNYSASDVTFNKKFAGFHKIGHVVPVTEEALSDSIFLESEINDLLFSGLVRAREDAILNGNGTTIYHGLINSTAQVAKDFNASYAKLAGEIGQANFWDALAVARLQVMFGENTGGVNDTNKKGFRPNFCFMNPATITKMKFLKGDDGHYFIPPWSSMSGQNYEGMTIVESFDIPVNYALIGDFTKANAYIKRDITISTSDNVSDDFLKDQMRMKAYQRMAFFVREHEKYAFVYTDLEAAVTAINQAVA